VGDPEPVRAPVLEPGEVVEVAAVRDRAHDPARLQAAHLLCDRLRDARDGVRSPCDETGELLVRRLPRARGGRVRAAVRVGDERVAEVREPASTRRLLHRGAHEVHGARRGRRDHGVDPRPAHDADRSRDRGQVPGDAGVGHEQPPRGDLRLDDRALEAVRGAQLLGRLPRPRPEVPRAVHPGLRRHAQLGVAVDPLRIVRGEHVRLDAERREVLRELQRALHAAAAGRREVQRDEQDLHRAKA
jgi:hypothetical protein